MCLKKQALFGNKDRTKNKQRAERNQTDKHNRDSCCNKTETGKTTIKTEAIQKKIVVLARTTIKQTETTERSTVQIFKTRKQRGKPWFSCSWRTTAETNNEDTEARKKQRKIKKNEDEQGGNKWHWNCWILTRKNSMENGWRHCWSYFTEPAERVEREWQRFKNKRSVIQKYILNLRNWLDNEIQFKNVSDLPHRSFLLVLLLLLSSGRKESHCCGNCECFEILKMSPFIWQRKMMSWKKTVELL